MKRNKNYYIVHCENDNKKYIQLISWNVVFIHLHVFMLSMLTGLLVKLFTMKSTT